MKSYVIIVAGGKGLRMQSAMPKQFLLLNNKPILYYSIKKFFDTFPDIHCILVLPEIHFESGEEIKRKKLDLENRINLATNIDDITNIDYQKELLNVVERKINFDSIK